jgi:hypothetical protein
MRDRSGSCAILKRELPVGRMFYEKMVGCRCYGDCLRAGGGIIIVPHVRVSDYAGYDNEWPDPRLTLAKSEEKEKGKGNWNTNTDQDFEEKVLESSLKYVVGTFGMLGVTPDEYYYDLSDPPDPAKSAADPRKALYIYARSFRRVADAKDLVDRDDDADDDADDVKLVQSDGGGTLGTDGAQETVNGADPYKYTGSFTVGVPNSVLFSDGTTKPLNFVNHSLSDVNNDTVYSGKIKVAQDGKPSNLGGYTVDKLKFDMTSSQERLEADQNVYYATDANNIGVLTNIGPFFVVMAQGKYTVTVSSDPFTSSNSVTFTPYSVTLNDLGGHFYTKLKAMLNLIGKQELRMANKTFTFKFGKKGGKEADLKKDVMAQFCDLIVQGRACAIADGVFSAMASVQRPLSVLKGLAYPPQVGPILTWAWKPFFLSLERIRDSGIIEPSSTVS